MSLLFLQPSLNQVHHAWTHASTLANHINSQSPNLASVKKYKQYRGNDRLCLKAVLTQPLLCNLEAERELTYMPSFSGLVFDMPGHQCFTLQSLKGLKKPVVKSRPLEHHPKTPQQKIPTVKMSKKSRRTSERIQKRSQISPTSLEMQKRPPKQKGPAKTIQKNWDREYNM